MAPEKSEGEDSELNIGRRTAVKSLAAAGLGLSFGGAGIAGASAGPETIDPDEWEPPHPNVERMVVDDSLKSLGSIHTVLVADEDAVLSKLEQSSIQGRELREHREFLYALWDEYEVVTEKSGNTVRYTLKDERAARDQKGLGVDTKSFSKDQDELVWETNRAMSAALSNDSDNVDTQWNPDGAHHEPMARVALNQLDMDKVTIEDYADYPDSLGCQCDYDINNPAWSVTPVESIVQDALDQLFHSWNHFWTPDSVTFSVGAHGFNVSWELGKIGGAVNRCDEFYSDAESSSGWSKEKDIGNALHIVQDVAMPFHSGAVLEQLSPSAKYEGWDFNGPNFSIQLAPKIGLHYAAEGYAASHFSVDNGKFRDAFVSEGTAGFPINSPRQAVKDAASESNEYSTSLFYNKFNSNDMTADDSWVDQGKADRQLENVHAMMGMYTRGFIGTQYDLY